MHSREHDNGTEAGGAEALAAQALTYLAEHPSDLDRFFALTGIAPDTLRQSAGEPGFAIGVLDYILSDERLLTAFAERVGIAPESIAQARYRLAGAPD